MVKINRLPAKQGKKEISSGQGVLDLQVDNLKVVGSNPTPATKKLRLIKCLEPDLISRVFACTVLVNTWSTFGESPLKSGGFCVLEAAITGVKDRAGVHPTDHSVSRSP